MDKGLPWRLGPALLRHEARSSQSLSLGSPLEFFQVPVSIRSASGGAGRSEMLTAEIHASLL